MPFRPCKKPGCRGLVKISGRQQKYCPSCAPRETQKDLERKREDYRNYNRTRRNPTVTRWLASSRYREARAAFLKANPLCVECQKPDRLGHTKLTPATVLDHIQAHKGDPVLFWDISNWQGLCFHCHNRKTNRFDGGYGNPIQ